MFGNMRPTMTRSAKWITIAIVLATIVLLPILWYYYPFSFLDSSLVVSERYVAIGGAIVENGSAYDQAAIDVTPYKAIYLPEDADVQIGAEEGKLQLFMRKTLSFGGHPPESMYLRDTRKHMGCALKAEDDALLVATFGEWDSHIEGGTFMGLLFLVPEGIEVRRKANLSGPNSAGREWNGSYLTKPKEVKTGYWYGPASPATGWSAIPDVPDIKRRAGDKPRPRGEQPDL
jgi:hypothetical protein